MAAPAPRPRSPVQPAALVLLALTTGGALWMVHGVFRALALLAAAYGGFTLWRRPRPPAA